MGKMSRASSRASELFDRLDQLESTLSAEKELTKKAQETMKDLRAESARQTARRTARRSEAPAPAPTPTPAACSPVGSRLVGMTLRSHVDPRFEEERFGRKITDITQQTHANGTENQSTMYGDGVHEFERRPRIRCEITQQVEGYRCGMQSVAGVPVPYSSSTNGRFGHTFSSISTDQESIQVSRRNQMPQRAKRA
jgi:hypothetical protein